ncbi:thiol-disulfide oxidoreductase DCC family protein [Parasediminibacterium paludis]|uniref:Thiol-disulfide oxidoreductase DCC family protein n=1 Tax=Parasediminibacterium paludis TaxID=908966 RepID=A0ABV8PWI9_9BACT
MTALQDIKQPVILFDGVCNLCNSAVQYVIKHDPNNHFLFASLQSQFGQQVLAANQLSNTNFNSFILLQNGIIYQRSTAALIATKQLSGAIRLLYWCIIVPSFIRDGVYNIIAKNRYKWFGKKDTCWLPSPELKNKFLD